MNEFSNFGTGEFPDGSDNCNAAFKENSFLPKEKKIKI